MAVINTLHKSSEDIQWYVYRYHVMSNKLKEQIKSFPLDTFLPYRYVKVINAKGKTDYQEQPVIPTYLFVRGSLKDVIEKGKELQFAPMRKHMAVGEIWNQDYVTVSDKDMHLFQQATELFRHDINFYDASVIDLEKDDRVIFLDGILKGTQGYLKSEQGRDGGVVVVPLNQNDSESNLFYSVTVKPESLGVIQFARGNQHFLDKHKSIRKVVDEAMTAYCQGESISPKQRERMLSYVFRFSQLKPNTDIQRANHLMLLYRIYTILELFIQRDEIGQKIQDKVLQSFGDRVEAKEKYLAQKAEADSASHIRKQTFLSKNN